MTKIVKDDHTVSGLSNWVMLKQYWINKRAPYVNIAEGPSLKHIIELLWMHSVGHALVKLELSHPRIHRGVIRVRNSLVFRYNRYRDLLNRIVFKN